VQLVAGAFFTSENISIMRNTL